MCEQIRIKIHRFFSSLRSFLSIASLRPAPSPLGLLRYDAILGVLDIVHLLLGLLARPPYETPAALRVAPALRIVSILRVRAGQPVALVERAVLLARKVLLERAEAHVRMPGRAEGREADAEELALRARRRGGPGQAHVGVGAAL